jgi:5'-nucleotidase (lipoprotein e(P4) family)
VSVALGATGLLVVATDMGLQSQQSPPPRALAIKYVRDSEEYAALARQVYRVAAAAAIGAARDLNGRAWGVVMDVDETALDNSAYQLERSAYGLPADAASRIAFQGRGESGVVPGAADFVARIRKAGGHVAWLSNREPELTQATRANLERVGLWNDDDRLCLLDTAQRTKAVRRAEVVTGRGGCSWSTPLSVLAFVGDQMSDFPTAAEGIPNTGTDSAFGSTAFLLPNPMYGEWTTRVTRQRR